MDRDTYWLACYVMLSRATSIEGLLVLRPAQKEDLNRKPPQYLLDEIDRLLRLERKCTARLASYIQSLGVPVPQQILNLFVQGAEQRELEEVLAARADRAAPSSSAPPGLGSASSKRVPSNVSIDAQAGIQRKRRRLYGKQPPLPIHSGHLSLPSENPEETELDGSPRGTKRDIEGVAGDIGSGSGDALSVPAELQGLYTTRTMI